MLKLFNFIDFSFLRFENINIDFTIEGYYK